MIGRTPHSHRVSSSQQGHRRHRWLQAAMAGILANALLQSPLGAWQEKDTSKSKPTRLQLYPNRQTEIDPREKEYQETRAQQLAKARKNARTQLDAMRVELAWLADPLLFSHPPGIKAVLNDANPVVEIRGVVQSHAIRQRALDLAQKHSESPIRDKILVLISPSLNRQEVATEELHARAEKFLSDKLIEFSQDLRIEEVYPSGTIRIGGRVLSYEDKLAISRAFRRLNGCLGVDNRVEVSPMTQDGELVTLITADGESSLPGRLEEKRNGPVALASSAKPMPSTAQESHPKETSDETPPQRISAVPTPIRPVTPTRRAEPEPAGSRVATMAPARASEPSGPTPAAQVTPEVGPSPRPLGPVKRGSAEESTAVTTGIATIEEATDATDPGKTVEPVGWGSRLFPGSSTAPAPTATTVPPGASLPNQGVVVESAPRAWGNQRPRLLMQPTPTAPANPRTAVPPAAPRGSSVRLLPNNAPPPGNESQPGVAPSRRSGFINSVGQPSMPRTQPYLSPIDVSQSGRITASQPQPVAPAESAYETRPTGSVHRHYQGRTVAMPGSVRLGSQPGLPVPPPAQSVATENQKGWRWPWDKPVEDEPSPTPTVRPTRAPSVAAWSQGVNPTAPAGSELPERQPIATSVNRPSTSFEDDPSPTILARPEGPRPGLGSVSIDSDPGLPQPRTADAALPAPATAPRLGSTPAPSRLRPAPAGELPPPSTGDIAIEPENQVVPPFVPIRRPEKNPARDNQALPGSRPQPLPAPATAGPSLGSIELDSEAIKRPLPSPNSLADLARKTCGGLITDLKTRKEGDSITLEITVKDALAEDEVLKRLCNLAAFTHPGIRLEISRGP